MPYEVYTRTRIRAGSPSVTITTLGRISLNTAATRFLEKKEAKFLMLLWDAEAKRIALKVATEPSKTSYTISYGVKGNGAGFSAKTFLDHIGYDQSKTSSFNADWNEPEEMFEVQLSPEAFHPNGRNK